MLEIAEIIWRRSLLKEQTCSTVEWRKLRTEPNYSQKPFSQGHISTKYPICKVALWKPGICGDRPANKHLLHSTTLNCYFSHLLLLLLLLLLLSAASSSSSSLAFFTFSDRAIQFVYRPPSILRLHLHTSTFHRSTNTIQLQLAVNTEQVLQNKHDKKSNI